MKIAQNPTAPPCRLHYEKRCNLLFSLLNFTKPIDLQLAINNIDKFHYIKTGIMNLFAVL